MKLEYKIGPEDVGLAYHEILSRHLACSRLMIKRIRLYGNLLINGHPRRMKDVAQEGEELVVLLPTRQGQEDNPESELPLWGQEGIQILYQDRHCLLCDKPAHLVTHPSYLHQENSLTRRLTPALLHPVNRLDRDTTGLVLLAKSGYAHHALSQQPFQKEYLALVHGVNIEDHGAINLPIARAEGSIMLREINHETGKAALTEYDCLRRWPTARVSLLRLRLLTGRTHQLRLHCLMMGHPLVGESLYGAHRYFKSWPAPPPKLRPVSDENRPGSGYQGEYLAPREKRGDLASEKPGELRKRLCLQWDQAIDHQALHAWSLRFRPLELAHEITIYAPLPMEWKLLLKQLDDFEARA